MKSNNCSVELSKIDTKCRSFNTKKTPNSKRFKNKRAQIDYVLRHFSLDLFKKYTYD